MSAYLRCLLLNEYTKSVPMSLSSCVREDLPPRSILVWCKWHRGHGQQGKVLEQAGKRTSRKQEVRLAFSPHPHHHHLHRHHRYILKPRWITVRLDQPGS